MRAEPPRIADIVAHLDELPTHARARRGRGAIALVRAIEPQVRAAIDRGYSLKEIVAILNEEGIPATVSTLKNALYRREPSERRRAGVDHADPRLGAIAHFGRHRSGIPASGDVLNDSFADSILVR